MEKLNNLLTVLTLLSILSSFIFYGLIPIFKMWIKDFVRTSQDELEAKIKNNYTSQESTSFVEKKLDKLSEQFDDLNKFLREKL